MHNLTETLHKDPFGREIKVGDMVYEVSMYNGEITLFPCIVLGHTGNKANFRVMIMNYEHEWDRSLGRYTKKSDDIKLVITWLPKYKAFKADKVIPTLHEFRECANDYIIDPDQHGLFFNLLGKLKADQRKRFGLREVYYELARKYQ